MPESLLDKLWNPHVVEALDDGLDLLYVDRILLYELTAQPSFEGLRRRGLAVRRPDAVLAVSDHAVSTRPDRTAASVPAVQDLLATFARQARAAGITHFDVDDARQGIVHVVAAEQGFALPGATIVCGDSHTCTLGALGALAFGLGSSDLQQALATRTVAVRKPEAVRIAIEGALGRGTYAKDLALYLLRELGTAAGEGAAIEYAGAAVAAMTMDERMTLANMTAELGARYALIGVDDTTLAYVGERQTGLAHPMLDRAMEHWRGLCSDPGAAFAREYAFDATGVSPRITWGTSPAQSVAINEAVPRVGSASPAEAAQWEAALAYMGLREGQPLLGERVDVVFIGSCTNSRLSDLRAAAAVVRGRRRAAHVRALVVPGSEQVRRAAEAEGLDRVFVDAGFEWRRAGCSMCVAANDDRVASGERCVSTSNRNFPNRQGHGARTHLASPATAAACAIAGVIADVREFLP